MRSLYSFVLEFGRKSYTVPDSFRHIVPILFSGPRFLRTLKKISPLPHPSSLYVRYLYVLANESSRLPLIEMDQDVVKKGETVCLNLLAMRLIDH